MKKTAIKLLALILGIVFVWATYSVISHYIQYREASAVNLQAQEMAFPSLPITILPDPEQTAPIPTETQAQETEAPETQPPEPMDEHAQYLANTDLAPLQEVNGDVFGWIYLPGTPISYPLLQTDNNDTYLHTAWNGTANNGGSIFMEQYCKQDFSGFNTILYGHNMADGSMFGHLHNYKSSAYWQAHPNVYIRSGSTILRYAIFSAFEADTTGDAYRLSFHTQAAKQTAINLYVSSSVWDCGIIPTTQDSILTLSTCTGTGFYETRWVVQGVCTGIWKI